MNDKILMSISFSVFGMLLIFGLGFVFPTINPYVVIKWIIIVAGVVFVYSALAYFSGAVKAVTKVIMKVVTKVIKKGKSAKK